LIFADNIGRTTRTLLDAKEKAHSFEGSLGNGT
jgi:hypothetical protein